MRRRLKHKKPPLPHLKNRPLARFKSPPPLSPLPPTTHLFPPPSTVYTTPIYLFLTAAGNDVDWRRPLWILCRRWRRWWKSRWRSFDVAGRKSTRRRHLRRRRRHHLLLRRRPRAETRSNAIWTSSRRERKREKERERERKREKERERERKREKESDRVHLPREMRR